MRPPDFGTRLDAKQRSHLISISAADNHNARTAGIHKFLKQGCHPCVGQSPFAINRKWRQRTVIIQQQRRILRLRYRAQEGFYFVFINSAQQHFLLTVMRRVRPGEPYGLFRELPDGVRKDSQSEFPPSGKHYALGLSSAYAGGATASLPVPFPGRREWPLPFGRCRRGLPATRRSTLAPHR